MRRAKADENTRSAGPIAVKRVKCQVSRNTRLVFERVKRVEARTREISPVSFTYDGVRTSLPSFQGTEREIGWSSGGTPILRSGFSLLRYTDNENFVLASSTRDTTYTFDDMEQLLMDLQALRDYKYLDQRTFTAFMLLNGITVTRWTESILQHIVYSETHTVDITPFPRH